MRLLTTTATTVEAGAVVVDVYQDPAELRGAAAAVDEALLGLVTAAVKQCGFAGKVGETMVLPTQGRLGSPRVVLAGVGPRAELDYAQLRRATAAAVRAAARAGATSVATWVPGAGSFGLEPGQAARATVEGGVLGGYRFDEYRSASRDAVVSELLVV